MRGSYLGMHRWRHVGLGNAWEHVRESLTEEVLVVRGSLHLSYGLSLSEGLRALSLT